MKLKWEIVGANIRERASSEVDLYFRRTQSRKLVKGDKIDVRIYRLTFGQFV